VQPLAAPAAAAYTSARAIAEPEGKAVAEQEQQVDFVPVKDQDILAERNEMWERFNQFTTYAIAGVAAILVLLAIFLA